jgi:hypothetical protein
MGNFVLTDLQDDQAAFLVTKLCVRKIQVSREKGGIRERQQERENLFVQHPFAPQFHADLPDRNPPTSEQLALTLKDIFVEDVHVRGLLNG